MPEIPRVHPPKQERSSRTLDALLDAAQTILARKTFAEMTIAEITKLAGSSSGSFYARFADKNVLLHALHERYVEETLRITRQVRSFAAGRKMPLREISMTLVYGIVSQHVRNRGILRALLIESLNDRRFAERALEMVREVAGILEPAIDVPGMSAERLREQIEAALLTVKATLDHDLFFGAALAAENGVPQVKSREEVRRLRRIFLASFESGDTNGSSKSPSTE
jgi:AcrR family transcriptional regulator